MISEEARIKLLAERLENTWNELRALVSQEKMIISVSNHPDTQRVYLVPSYRTISWSLDPANPIKVNVTKTITSSIV